MSIQVKKTVLTPVVVYAMDVTFQTILPAPPAGYVNNILGISGYNDFQSAAYVGATTFYVLPASSNAQVFAIESTLLGSNTTLNSIFDKFSSPQMILSTEGALMLRTDAAGSIGDSDIWIYVIYEQKLIDL